jgi:hypothetical protein
LIGNQVRLVEDDPLKPELPLVPDEVPLDSVEELPPVPVVEPPLRDEPDEVLPVDVPVEPVPEAEPVPVVEPVEELLLDDEPLAELLVPALTSSPSSPLTVRIVPANGAFSFVSARASSASSTLTWAF